MILPKDSAQAHPLHFNSLVIDGLEAAPMTREHFNRLRAGGVDIVHYTCAKVTDDFAAACLNLKNLQQTVRENSDLVTLVKNAGEIQAAYKEGKVGILPGFQSATPVMADLRFLDLLHQYGVRVIQLTYNERNLLGDGCIEPSNAGLSRFGRRVVERMNALGIAVDLSHCGERTTLEGIEASSLPVLITHANAKHLCPSPRNKSDAVLKALAENGGVIGAVFWGPITYSDPNRRPGLDDFLNHIDYLVEQAGIDHVGIGSDLGEGEARDYYEAMFMGKQSLYPEITQELGDWYTFDTRMVEGLESATCFPKVTQGLLQRGYSQEDIQKILGGNLLRALSQIIG